MKAFNLNLKNKILFVSIFGVLAGIILSISIGYSSMKKVSEHSADDTLKILNSAVEDKLINELDKHSQIIENAISYTLDELAVMSDILQDVFDKYDDNKDLYDNLWNNPNIKEDLVYNGKWYQNKDDGQSVVLVKDYMLDENKKIPKEIMENIRKTAVLDIILPSFVKNGTEKLHVYYNGPRGQEFTRLYPYSNIGEALDEIYPEHNNIPNWDFYYPKLVDTWIQTIKNDKAIQRMPQKLSTITPFYTDGDNHEVQVMTSFIPIWDKKREKFMGALGIDITANWLLHKIKDIRKEETCSHFLIDNSGNIIAASKSITSILGIGSQENKSNGLNLLSSGLPLSSSSNKEIRELVLPAEKNKIYKIKLKDQYYHIAIQKLKPHYFWNTDKKLEYKNWFIGTLIPESYTVSQAELVRIEIENARRLILNKQLAISAATIIVLILFITVITSNMTKDITALTYGVQTILRGQYEYKILINSKDEIGDLASSFNQLTNQLHSTFSELESKNKDLEEEILQRANVEKRYKDIFLNANEGIFQITLSGSVITANPALLKILGFNSIEEIKNNVKDLRKILITSPEKLQEFNNILHQKGMVSDYIATAGTKEGKLITISISAKTTRDNDENILYIDGFAKDITERYNTENLKRAMEVVESHVKAKSQFLNYVSHEIRTPMNSILGFAELLKNENDENTKNTYLDSILYSGKSLMNLINDILDLSRIDTGKLEVRYQPTSVGSIINETLAFFKEKISEKDIEMVVAVSENFPKYINFDELRLRQILMNLLSNAVKYTESGYIRILADAYKVSNSAFNFNIIVQDSGEGIEPQDMENIFEILDEDITQKNIKYGGTGLGLTLTKRLVEVLGGDISASSTVEEGTKFIVNFYDVEQIDINEILLVEKVENKSIKFEGKSLVLADDDEYNRTLLSNMLSISGLNIFTAEDGRSAYLAAKKYLPDIIILDKNMPVTNGEQAIKMLKDDDKTKNIPIILVSGDSELENSGADKYLEKPFTKDNLYKIIDSLISKNNISVNTQFFNISEFDIEKASELLVILENDYVDRWKKICETRILDDINRFCSDIILIAKKSQLGILVNWANDMLLYTKQFDIEKITSHMPKFSDILSEIRYNINKSGKK